MELEDYEFDILWDENKGAWVADLQRGNYLINMKAPGFKEVNQFLELNLDERFFKLLCTPLAV